MPSCILDHHHFNHMHPNGFVKRKEQTKHFYTSNLDMDTRLCVNMPVLSYKEPVISRLVWFNCFHVSKHTFLPFCSVIWAGFRLVNSFVPRPSWLILSKTAGIMWRTCSVLGWERCKLWSFLKSCSGENMILIVVSLIPIILVNFLFFTSNYCSFFFNANQPKSLALLQNFTHPKLCCFSMRGWIKKQAQ